MAITMSPEYWPCPECGNGEFWVLGADGRLMCANWPECGRVYESAATLVRRKKRQSAGQAET